ncbi:MAG: glycine oxidase [Thiomicrorhabdus sp.]|nr:MAG: glycine oxidase [Thiomicrorhabdus sp.]
MPSSNTKPTIAILGAGLMGRMLAVTLKDNFEVELFDQDDGEGEQSAAFLAAAMLAPLAESADSSRAVMELGQLALKRWPEFLKELSEPVYFQHEGSLIIAFDQDQGDLKQFKSRLKGDGYQDVNNAQIDALEPDLNKRFNKGLFLPNEGQLDNRDLLKALKHELNAAGVNWHKNVVISASTRGYLQNGVPLKEYDWVFDCRGFGAKNDGIVAEDDAGGKSNLRGVRGEVARIRAPKVKITRPIRLMHPRYPMYITPKADGLFVIGATQVESEDTRNPTVRSSLELLTACFSVHTGFAEAEIISIDSGLRPAYLDNEPKIIVKGNEISINGLYRHGYLLAPMMVDQCVSIINGQQENSIISKIMPDLVKTIKG